ncbi:MAG: ankyrin repeat domain-containing protein, partial [bacterium]|nr:ankyrin repeat domain-containing protein [Candidatus Kapabacteria bacterium]
MLSLWSSFPLLRVVILLLLTAASAHAQRPVVHELHSQDTSFFNAARDGDDNTLRRILDAGANPNVDNNDGWTPLMLAAMNGNAGGVNILLEHGADPNFGEADQGPPLSVAAMSPFAALDETSIIRLMLDKGASIDIPNGSGMTPLMYAAREGNFNRAAYLIERGASVNHRDTRGWTPIRFAASSRTAQMVRLLAAHGANPDVLDEAFRTPLHYSVTERSTEIATILLDALADVNGISVTGGYPTPLALASTQNDTAMIVLLLKRGATPNYSDMGSNNDGVPRTPLDWAKHHRNKVAERALVATGALSIADLQKVSRDMLKAARRGDEKAFTKLLARKIDPRVGVSEGGA